MKHRFYIGGCKAASVIAACLVFMVVFVAGCYVGDRNAKSTTTKQVTQAQPQSQPRLEEKRQDAEKQVRPEVEKERQSAKARADQSLDKDAIFAIDQTGAALRAIAKDKKSDAAAAVEAATGKINTLLARNAAAAMVPVSSDVQVIDDAPTDEKAIQAINDNLARAVITKDYPRARLLLSSLTSEIRVRVYNLPLATYPTALKDAARLLDQGKKDQASQVLLNALNSLAIVERVTPIPVVLARTAITVAEEQTQKDKSAAQALLMAAKDELKRGQELGYRTNDPQFAAVNTNIEQLQKQLKGNGETGELFAKVKDDLSSFFNRESAPVRR